jgi:hypothetical protein
MTSIPPFAFPLFKGTDHIGCDLTNGNVYDLRKLVASIHHFPEGQSQIAMDPMLSPFAQDCRSKISFTDDIAGYSLLE